MSDDEYDDLNDKFSIYCSSTRDTSDGKKIWEVEIIDHNDAIWIKELICNDTPRKEDLIKSYWINKNSFTESHLTIREARELKDCEDKINSLHKVREFRKNISDKRNAFSSHNITFQEEKPSDLLPKFDNSL